MTPLHHNCETLYGLSEGQRVYIGDDPYIVGKRSRGGMGFILFLEFDGADRPSRMVHGRRVAIKSALPTALDGEAMGLFRRELVVWSGFRCNTIVGLNEILDAGRDGWVAAMDWYPGSLRDLLIRSGHTAPPDAIRVVCDILNALAYAYKKDGVLHLDIKPENILYDLGADRAMRRGVDSFQALRFMLSDWGLVSIKQPRLNAIAGMPPSNEAWVKTLNNMWTTLYMAPERFIKGYHSSPASDVFSLGMVFLELLTGRLPFRNDGAPQETLLSFSYFQAASALLESADLPTSLRRLILSMLAPNPSERPMSYDSLQNSLISFSRRTSTFLGRWFS